MDRIPLENWGPDPEKPQYMKYAGPRTAQEVFQELRQRLDSMGYLPDEYFEMDDDWNNGREIPKDADLYCTTDYGGSEGIYTDVYLKWFEDGKPVTKSFITGKTLGETGLDLDRMFLISSAITKAFHGDGGSYSRYLRTGGDQGPEGTVIHLNGEEKRVLLDALVEKGIDAADSASHILHCLYASQNGWMAEHLLERGLKIDLHNMAALHACIRNGGLKSGQILLDRGMDFEQYRQWAETNHAGTDGHDDTLQALAEHWTNRNASYEQDNSGQTLS